MTTATRARQLRQDAVKTLGHVIEDMTRYSRICHRVAGEWSIIAASPDHSEAHRNDAAQQSARERAEGSRVALWVRDIQAAVDDLER